MAMSNCSSSRAGSGTAGFALYSPRQPSPSRCLATLTSVAPRGAQYRHRRTRNSTHRTDAAAPLPLAARAGARASKQVRTDRPADAGPGRHWKRAVWVWAKAGPAMPSLTRLDSSGGQSSCAPAPPPANTHR